MNGYREKKLLKNTGLYFIGNFASKILNFLLVPIYMIYLEADVYGEIDLILLFSSVIALFFSLDMIDAAYRFILDANSVEEKSKVITNSVTVFIIGMFILSFLYIPINIYFDLKYGELFIMHIIITNFLQLMMQICRGLRLNVHYAISGSILTLLQGILNVMLIIVFKQGASSLLIAPIISSFIVVLYLLKIMKISKYIKISLLGKKTILEMTRYSMPMFVQVLLLWVLQNSGTYFLSYYTEGNVDSGIYAISNKFPAIINSLASIFLLAWQESAIISKNDKDATQYYSRIYSIYFSVMTICTIVMLPILRIYFVYVGNESYRDVWKYVPIFCATAVINSLSIFVGTHFIAEKKTIKIVKTLIIPVVVTLVINIFLINRLGIYALGIGQILGYMLVLMQRKKETRNVYRMTWDKKNILLLLISINICMFYYSTQSIMLQLVCFFSATILIICIYRKEVEGVIKILKNRLCK